MKVLHGGKAIIVGLEKVNLDEFPSLRVLSCNMTSIEHLPLEECKKRGIKVISLQGETEFLKNVTSTAEHTIGLMIALLRNYHLAFDNTFENRDVYTGHTLRDKKFGIIGFGRVGKQVAIMCSSLTKWNIHFYDTNKDLKTYEGFVFDESIEVKGRSLKKVLERSDVLSLHIPLKENEGFFTKEMFAEMKTSAVLINTSRPGIVEKGALLWALKNKKIAGAAVDFVDDPELVKYSKSHYNLILTPHCGGNTFEDRKKTEEFIEKKVINYLNGSI